MAGAEEVGAGGAPGVAPDPAEDAKSSAGRAGGDQPETAGAGSSPSAGDGPGRGGDAVSSASAEDVVPRSAHSATCTWRLPDFATSRARQMWSEYRDVGGHECRLLVYPRGDSQALPGYVSVYLQVNAPTDQSAARRSNWECFVSYELSVRDPKNADANAPPEIARDSWHRFSSRKKSHGWCDFAPFETLILSKGGLLVDGALEITARITVLSERCQLARDDLPPGHTSAGEATDVEHAVSLTAKNPNNREVLAGKFTWEVDNFSEFREMIKTQKVMSPSFPAGDCNFRLSVYQSQVHGAECLSMCLESKESDQSAAGAPSGGASKVGGDPTSGVMNHERSCWLLFRMTVVNAHDPRRCVHRDSYGRFASDASGGDNTSLGWNDFMPMAVFAAEGGDVERDGGGGEAGEGGFLIGPDGRASFSVSFHVVKEACEARADTSVSKSSAPTSVTLSEDGGIVGAGGGVRTPGVSVGLKGRGGRGGKRGDARGGGKDRDPSESTIARFVWRVDNFTRLKDILKKRKISGLCVKSRRFQVGGRDCRLIIYPRGQSQPPNHLSMFLEVTDPRSVAAGKTDWSCFVSHRLAVYNQKNDENSVAKESQNRYSRVAKDWGWREFVTLTALFDQDSGFLVDDTVVFTAEVLVLKESYSSGEIDAKRLKLTGRPPALKFNPKRLEAFIAEYGLDEKEKEAAKLLFGERFEVLKQRALHKAKDASDKASNDSNGDAPSAPPPDEDDIELQAPSVAQMAYCKAATGANLKIADEFLSDDGMRPLTGEAVDAVFTWRVENFAAFKHILETRKIFSQYFSVDAHVPKKMRPTGCQLRIGVYESFDTLCIYLESDAASKDASAAAKDTNYWVRYRMGLVNQRDPEKTLWKENTVCTKTANTQVLQLFRVSECLEPWRGFMQRETVVFACEILDFCPWFDIEDIEAPPAGASGVDAMALGGVGAGAGAHAGRV